MTVSLDGRALAGVLFDYGGTLVTLERPDEALDATFERIRAHLRELGLPAPEATVLLSHVHDRVEAEFEAHQRSGALEEIDLVAAARRAYAEVGVRLDDAALDAVLRLEQEAWWHGVRVDPDAVLVLDELRRSGLRVGLCSNAPYRVRSMHEQLEHFGLDAHLDSVTFSGAVGWRKPSPIIFEAATRALGVAPQATLMVGDTLRDDIEGARAAGLSAALLRRRAAPGAPPKAVSLGVRVIEKLSELPGLLALTHDL